MDISRSRILSLIDAQGLGVLGGDDYAPGVPVYAVAQGRGKGILLPGIPLAALGHIGLNIGDEGVIIPLSGAVAQHPGLFIQQKDVLVLVDDVQPGSAHFQVGVLLPGLFKKLVVYIKLQKVPGLQPGVPPGALAVELDALEADVLLQKSLRQQRHGLAHKAVQPLPGVVGADCQFLHYIPSCLSKFFLKTFDFLQYTI